MAKNVANNEFDVIVIGGGVTGVGTARDCALRGLRVLLVERYDLTHGASGRNHGLLHSGARYAVTDPQSAAECVAENRILRQIARHCVEPTGGLFVGLPDDDPQFKPTFLNACHRVGIDATEISTRKAIEMEPAVNPLITSAITVPDAAVDPFRLTIANALDATRHGAQILTYTEVTGIITSGGEVTGINTRNTLNGSKLSFYARVVVNAAGVWGQHIATMAGVTLTMHPSRGALLIFGHRVNNMVINRLRRPADADILVPDDIVCVLGTTGRRVPIEEVDNTEVTTQEVNTLLSEGVNLAPRLASTRIIRAYAGVRPLVASDNNSGDRSISRGIVLIDHASRDGLQGFITITGGKLVTYRLMAEMTTDLICRKLGVNATCTTAVAPLPGSEPDDRDRGDEQELSSFAHRAAENRHGRQVDLINDLTPNLRSLVCECEHVSRGEVEYAISTLGATNLSTLRRRTRLGMGTCQGKMCACRAAALLTHHHGNVADNLTDLHNFLNERWKGVRPIAWGTALSEAQLTAMTYQGLCGINSPSITINGSDEI